MCPPDPQRAHHRRMQRIHLTLCLPGSSWPNVPCSWLPCFSARCELPWYKRMPPWLTVLAWRQRLLSGARVFLHCVITCRQQHLPISRSKRQLAWGSLGGWLV